MRILIVTSLLVLAGCKTLHGPCYLRSLDSGLIQSEPSDFSLGSQLFTPDLSYRIDQPRQGEFETIQRLKEIVIRDIDVRNSDVQRVIDTVNAKQKVTFGDKAIPVLLDLSDYHLLQGGCVGDALRIGDNSEGDRKDHERVPPLTFSVSQISLFSLLKMISAVTRIPLNIYDHRVLLSQKPMRTSSSQPAQATDPKLAAPDK